MDQLFPFSAGPVIDSASSLAGHSFLVLLMGCAPTPTCTPSLCYSYTDTRDVGLALVVLVLYFKGLYISSSAHSFAVVPLMFLLKTNTLLPVSDLVPKSLPVEISASINLLFHSPALR